MKRIYKYKIPVEDYVEIDLPEGAKVLSFQCQREAPVIWALVDPGAPPQKRRFRFAGTGHSINEATENLSFIGTAQMASGALICHLFEMLE